MDKIFIVLFWRSWDCSKEHLGGVLNEFLESLEPFSADSSIDDTMITAESEVHDSGGGDWQFITLCRSITRDETLLSRSDSKNTSLF